MDDWAGLDRCGLGRCALCLLGRDKQDGKAGLELSCHVLSLLMLTLSAAC